MGKAAVMPPTYITKTRLMKTGEIKTQIDNIWDTFGTGSITNSITILEQMTYLFFINKRLSQNVLHPKSFVSNFWGAVQFETASFSSINRKI